MPGPTFIEGDSIDLRTIEEGDLEFLQEGTNHPAVRRYAGGDLPYNRPRYENERFDMSSDGGVLQLLICDGDDRVGDVSLAPIDERRGWANLGYWIHPDRQGQGYATEAARLVVTHGFEELRLHRISATIVAHNEASKRVVEKLGFVHEGTKRDDAFIGGEYVDREVYAVLGDEWSGGSDEREAPP
jgi:RimJ/RimL family protein N-acetyltransferase